MPKDKRLKDFYGMKDFAHYIGFGGENLVKAELLLRGINVAKPIVDDKVDLVVIKNEGVESVQVKTAFLDSERDRYSFNLSSIEKDDKITYVFVLVEKAGKYNFLIITPKRVQQEIKKESVYLNKSTGRYRAVVYSRENKIFMGNLKNEMTDCLNNWTILTSRNKKIKDNNDSSRIATA